MESYVFLTFANLIATYGKHRGIGFAISFLISFFGTPFIGIICVMLSEKINKDDDNGQQAEKTFDIEQFRQY
ncbi:hypothetical protein QWY31_12995 [Cytophagales bacterium LB-30]|uniref:Uncharacterized protein n=1 Tax=Shiella aurantiaca TaxID=3058365 RepID=A0ABT8F7H5_9BACT|nr:hypothetical protein [Shiella aurantiaca]MDN4166420.1 hypothetical protein [Shiella aurantiaca]